MTATRPRLRDVARDAGVSTMTVVRVMREPAKVASQTRARVEAVIARTGYTPDLHARGLALQRTGVVAAIVPLLTNSLIAEVVHGLTDQLEAEGIHLLLGPSGFSAAREEALVRAFLSRRVDAVFLTGTSHTATTRKLLAAARIPVVEGSNLPREPIDMAVGFSNRDAAIRVTRHLIGRGYDPIGFIGAHTRDNDRAADRLAGFREAMRAARRPLSPELVIETSLDMTAGAEAVGTLLARRPDLRAVLCSADAIAAGALLACQRRGVRVPERVAIAGFDDIEIARLVTPALTTIRVPRLQIGQTAAAMILARLAGRRVRRRVVDTGFELIVRDSA
ncbi:MAG: LacI family DNA-binding transcriptional regulator [Alphaproteobacteria bacterium]|nr:LacI family DNA-binding transcriptional regulator [Alphaproteobacteria bacterium]